MPVQTPVYQEQADIADFIGRTPLLRLRRLPGAAQATLLAKAEFLNPGGSVKSRTALGMIKDAEAKGILRPGTTILEATSGNEGIALAMLGAARGYRVRIVMPADVPKERQLIIEAYGGEVVLTPVGASIDETIRTCLQAAEELAKEPGTFYARQFENPANPEIHEQTTAKEILEQAPANLAAVVAGVGTGGTLMGLARCLKAHLPHLHVVAVEPATAAPLSGGPIGNHGQFGIGEGFIPPLVDTGLIDEVVTVTDEEALSTARLLARTEGLLVGISSGSNVAAALRVAKRLGPGAPVVTLLPDSAERYFSSALFQGPGSTASFQEPRTTAASQGPQATSAPGNGAGEASQP